MYIRKLNIMNVRSLKEFEMVFEPPFAGWHVVIGDNGAGKSSLIRAAALALVGPVEAIALRQNWLDWLNKDSQKGHIHMEIDYDPLYDKRSKSGKTPKAGTTPPCQLEFSKKEQNGVELSSNIGKQGLDPGRFNWGNGKGWFSVAYGPFRRFTGGNKDWEKLFYSNPKLAAHLSAFGEDVALTEALSWLQQLRFSQLESPDTQILDHIIRFINQGGLLPHGAMIEEITSKGVFFRDGNGAIIPVVELSDGYRSILSLTFELIRQLVATYGEIEVFKNFSQFSGPLTFDLPGVVLIDEIDSHLHPTWQIRIGEWFLKHFPNIQFIITTHSPLICHAAESGSVWRLAAPGSPNRSGKIEGDELHRLVYGSILDAYGTEMFGRNVTRSQISQEKLQELAILNRKAIRGKLSSSEADLLKKLQTIFPSTANTLEI